MRILTFIFLLLTGSLAAAQACTLNTHPLSARYQVEYANRQASAAKQAASTVENTLWRRGSEAALQYHATGVSEIWNLQTDRRIRLLRIFENYDRGIEYQASEIRGGQNRDWSAKVQLISDDLLARMRLTGTEGSGCDLLQRYSLSVPEARNGMKFMSRYQVDYLPAQKLVQSMTRTTSRGTEKWQLLEVTRSAEAVDRQFDRWHSLYTTDYTDIGDNETDRFLMSMINLGFIEHGASGFYNADGSRMQGGHTHNIRNPR